MFLLRKEEKLSSFVKVADFREGCKEGKLKMEPLARILACELLRELMV